MHTQHVANLGGARLLKPFALGAQGTAKATAVQAGVIGVNGTNAMPEASPASTQVWYRPQRFSSQSERIPI
jgi:hypothetical protein